MMALQKLCEAQAKLKKFDMEFFCRIFAAETCKKYLSNNPPNFDVTVIIAVFIEMRTLELKIQLTIAFFCCRQS